MEELNTDSRTIYELLRHEFTSMGCNFTLCHNTYGYSLLFLQGLHEEGECRQLEFWAGKGANIGGPLCATPKALKLHGMS